MTKPRQAVPNLAALANRRLVVWGAGREGLELADLLTTHVPSAHVEIVDDKAGAPVVRIGNGETEREIGVQRVGLDAVLQSADIVFRSPGISAYTPRSVALVESGVLVTGSTALWFAETRGRGVVGVTGTKGKSTTASLIAHFFAALGVSVELGGNIGVPVVGWLNDAASERPERYVVELSSFQLTDLTDSPDVGVVTSLFPDHLDWHGSLAQYEEDKFNLFGHRHDTIAVLNDSYATIHDVVTRTDLKAWVGDIVWYQNSSSFNAQGTAVYHGEQLVIPCEVNPLLGTHNAQNIAAALTVLDVLGYKPLAIQDLLVDALRDFHPLDHRLEVVIERNGVRWVDDGLSTNCQGAMAALDSFPQTTVTLLVGGFDRGIDYAPLAEHIAARSEPTTILCMPDNGPRIAETLHEAVLRMQSNAVILEARDLIDAVEQASRLTPRGGVVLLSPAAPSFGRFVDYEDRGRVFLRAIENLGSVRGA